MDRRPEAEPNSKLTVGLEFRSLIDVVDPQVNWWPHSVPVTPFRPPPTSTPTTTPVRNVPTPGPTPPSDSGLGRRAWPTGIAGRGTPGFDHHPGQSDDRGRSERLSRTLFDPVRDDRPGEQSRRPIRISHLRDVRYLPAPNRHPQPRLEVRRASGRASRFACYDPRSCRRPS